MAPPLLLIVTPGATWMLDEVDPDVVVVVPVVDVVWLPVVVEADTVDDGDVETDVPVEAVVVPVFVVPAVVVVPVFVVPAVVVVPSVAAPSPVEVDEVSPSVAHATPGEVTTAMPIPNAAANVPTRPM